MKQLLPTIKRHLEKTNKELPKGWVISAEHKPVGNPFVRYPVLITVTKDGEFYYDTRVTIDEHIIISTINFVAEGIKVGLLIKSSKPIGS